MQESLFNKIAGLRPETLLKKRLWHLLATASGTATSKFKAWLEVEVSPLKKSVYILFEICHFKSEDFAMEKCRVLRLI